MSIIPISRLQLSDLALLGTNLSPDSVHRPSRRSRRRRGQLGPVNRSLSLLGEKVDCLYPTGPGALRRPDLHPVV